MNDDPALAAWTAAHVAYFMRATPPCECFACLSHRARVSKETPWR